MNKPPSTRLKKIDALKKIRQHHQKRVLPSAAVSEGHRPVHFLPPKRFPERQGLETRYSETDGLGPIDAQPDGFVFQSLTK